MIPINNEIFSHFQKELKIQEFFDEWRQMYLKQAVADRDSEGRLRACGVVEALDELLANTKKVKT